MTIKVNYWLYKITKGVLTMNISILRTTLFCVALALTLLSDKLFKQHAKIVKIIFAIVAAIAALSFLF